MTTADWLASSTGSLGTSPGPEVKVQDSSPTRREFQRVHVRLTALLEQDGVPAAEGLVENVSLKGGYFRLDCTLPVGLACAVRILLDGSVEEVRARGRIVRSGPEGCAVEFSEILGVDSLEHLKNLILYNAEDPAQAAREFHEHTGLLRG